MDKDIKAVPYIVYEGAVARLERVCRRLWILCIIIFLSFVASNAFWIWYEGQFQTETTTITQEATADDGSDIHDIYLENKHGCQSETDNQDDAPRP